MLKSKKTEAELAELFRVRTNDRTKLRSRNKKRSRPEKASEVLTRFFKDDPEALRKMRESRALSSWIRFVGKEAAQFSKPVKITNGEMLVYVSDPLWLHQLLMLKNQILNCFRKDFPDLKLKQIFFKRGVLN